MDAKLEKVLNRLKRQYEAYENELNVINDDTDGMIDISVACSLANSIPYLINQIEKQQKELSFMKDGCNYNNEAHKNTLEKLERDEKAIEDRKVCDKCNLEIRKMLKG